MGYIAKLSHGFRILDISSGRYALMQDFIPPTVEEVIYTAAGTSANRTRGASNIGKRAVNRDWDFSFRAMGTSIAETDRAIFFQKATNSWTCSSASVRRRSDCV